MSVFDTDQWRAFIAAIRANPGDDTVRLIAADWLEEHGEADRADLIRVMCAVSPSGRLACQDGRTRVHRRAKELLTAHRPLPGVQFRRLYLGYYATAPEGRVRLWYSRGFADEAEASAAWWLAHGDAILVREPVERVTLTTWPEGSVTKVERQRAWKRPPRLGGHILDCWRAEWPGVEFTLPEQITPAVLPGQASHVTASPDPAGVTFRLPPTLIGDVDGANRSTMSAAIDAFAGPPVSVDEFNDILRRFAYEAFSGSDQPAGDRVEGERPGE